MKTKIYELSGSEKRLIATFEDYDKARNWSILAARAEVFDYILENGRRPEEIIRSYKRVKCPGCGANYTFNELSKRFSFGDKLCDCGTRFYTHGLKFNGEICEKYID